MKVRKIKQRRVLARKIRVKSRIKRVVNIRHLARQFKRGVIFETCGVDVAIVTKVDAKTDTIEHLSLTTHQSGNCSLCYCGPVRLTEQGIKKRLDLFAAGGKRALVRRYYIEDCKMSPMMAERELNAKEA